MAKRRRAYGNMSARQYAGNALKNVRHTMGVVRYFLRTNNCPGAFDRLAELNLHVGRAQAYLGLTRGVAPSTGRSGARLNSAARKLGTAVFKKCVR